MFKHQFTLLLIALETHVICADQPLEYKVKHPENKDYAINEKFGFHLLIN